MHLSAAKNKQKITTIKLSEKTKQRIDSLRIYRRESYDDLLQRLLEILSLTRLDSQAARAKLLFIEKSRAPRNEEHSA